MLTVLAEEPATGYEITKIFDQSMRYFWNASHQQIYRYLRDLAKDGFVETQHVVQSHRPDKIVYRLTSHGREALRDWASHGVQPKVNSEILIKGIAAAAFGASAVTRLLEEQREIHVKRREHYREIERVLDVRGIPIAGSLEETMRLMALRRGIRGEEDWIGWIDEAMQAVHNTLNADIMSLPETDYTTSEANSQ
jgi:PadR family transcriptional regulator, regulatory protein AphA